MIKDNWDFFVVSWLVEFLKIQTATYIQLEIDRVYCILY